jgi:hypothetical protein
MEVRERIAAVIQSVTREPGDVIDYQFSIVDQRQTARGGIAKQLIPEAALETCDDFSHVRAQGCL